jgi:hypothetical protein
MYTLVYTHEKAHDITPGTTGYRFFEHIHTSAWSGVQEVVGHTRTTQKASIGKDINGIERYRLFERRETPIREDDRRLPKLLLMQAMLDSMLDKHITVSRIMYNGEYEGLDWYIESVSSIFKRLPQNSRMPRLAAAAAATASVPIPQLPPLVPYVPQIPQLPLITEQAAAEARKQLEEEEQQRRRDGARR